MTSSVPALPALPSNLTKQRQILITKRNTTPSSSVINQLESQLSQSHLTDPNVENLDNHVELPFRIIEPGYALQLFKESYAGSLPEIPIPDFVQWIPTSKIKEFSTSIELQFGYLETLFSKDFEYIRSQLKEVEEAQNEIIVKLQKEIHGEEEENEEEEAEIDREREREREGSDGRMVVLEQCLLKRLNNVQFSLQSYHELLKGFEDKQIEMYDALHSISKDALITRYDQLAFENEKKCAELIDEATRKTTDTGSDNDDDDDDDANKKNTLSSDDLSALLEAYGQQRKSWHKNREIASQLRQGIVADIQ